jgi:hypothetical protein
MIEEIRISVTTSNIHVLLINLAWTNSYHIDIVIFLPNDSFSSNITWFEISSDVFNASEPVKNGGNSEAHSLKIWSLIPHFIIVNVIFGVLSIYLFFISRVLISGIFLYAVEILLFWLSKLEMREEIRISVTTSNIHVPLINHA